MSINSVKMEISLFCVLAPMGIDDSSIAGGKTR